MSSGFIFRGYFFSPGDKKPSFFAFILSLLCVACPPGFFSGILFYLGNPRLVFLQKIVPLFLPAAGTLDYFFIVYRLHIRIPHDFLMKNEWSFGLLEWLTFSAP